MPRQLITADESRPDPVTMIGIGVHHRPSFSVYVELGGVMEIHSSVIAIVAENARDGTEFYEFGPFATDNREVASVLAEITLPRGKVWWLLVELLSGEVLERVVTT